MKTVFVGVAGGTGSGKTTISRRILEAFQPVECVLLEQDSYYKDLKNLSVEERAMTNFDHPDSIDFNLLISHLNDLKNDKEIKTPIYDFTIHTRKEEYKTIKPAKIVILEGILIFTLKKLRDLFDMKIFIDTDSDERLLRRIERDMKERGRSFDSVKEQYLSTVKPMYLEFVDPSKRYADIIIPRGGKNLVAIKMVVAKLRSLI